MSGGFLLVMALLFYFDDQCLLPGFLLACAFHECGHWAAICLMGGAVRELHLTAMGAELCLDRRKQMSYGGEIISALAGPFINCLLALLSAAKAPVFSGLNLILGLFNLLPVLPLDGGRLFYFLLALLCSEEQAERICRKLTMAVSLLIGAAGWIVLKESGYNFTLLLIAVWLLFLVMEWKGVANRRRNR